LKKLDLDQSTPASELAFFRAVPPQGLSMRAPNERDQCQANLDRMVDAFMYNDWRTFREAVALLRDYVDQNQIAQGKMRRGRNWYTPKQVDAMRKHARSIFPVSVPRVTPDSGR
jgi:hypothetical protein